jgi:hypothetical protein
VLNLLLQDWGALHWACFVVEDAQKIAKFIRPYHVLLVLFHKHGAISAQGLSLLTCAVTQFATNFFMVVRALDLKETLKQTVTIVEWNMYNKTESNMQKKPMRMQAQKVRRLILSDDTNIWQSCVSYCTVTNATVAALKKFDGKKSCMGNVI